jgi:hypothetical protein
MSQLIYDTCAGLDLRFRGPCADHMAWSTPPGILRQNFRNSEQDFSQFCANSAHKLGANFALLQAQYAAFYNMLLSEDD